jgi:Rad3-related DNA helicase
MSGTILNPAIESKDLGINEYDYFQFQSTFPVQNRPIYYTPVTDVSYKNMQSALPKLRDLLGETIDQYPNGKILVHTVSYDIRNYLMNNLRTDREIITHDTSTRTEMLNHFKESKNSVIMSPSFDRGVDLPEEDNCQCVFVCKMPFMNLGDPQVKARKALPDGAEWYALKALQSLMQMTGRSIRSSTQKCDTVIADSNFARLRYLTRFYIPKWWSDAIINKPIKVRF